VSCWTVSGTFRLGKHPTPWRIWLLRICVLSKRVGARGHLPFKRMAQRVNGEDGELSGYTVTKRTRG
jgi:hypothetical protein